ncbi:MAG: hypothetical protein J2P25_22935 [Nocardiopsaceae bacterium]|nr:hypothetical protein [Nocardiopsaceae bacterium]
MKKTTMRALSLPVLGAAAVGAFSLLGTSTASASTTGGSGSSASGAVSGTVSDVSRTVHGVSGTVSGVSRAVSGVSRTASGVSRAVSGVSGTVSKATSSLNAATGRAGSSAQAPAHAASQQAAQTPARAASQQATASGSDSTRTASGSADGHSSAASSGSGLSSQPQVLHNAALGSSYFLNHLQYEHLDQPYVGFGPAIQNPTYWFSNHFIPVALNTASLTATGDYATSTMDESSSGGSGSQVPQVLHNAALGSSFFLNHLQYEHLDQPYLGFGPAIQNPTYWFSNHFIPVALNTASLAATGHSASGGM